MYTNDGPWFMIGIIILAVFALLFFLWIIPAGRDVNTVVPQEDINVTVPSAPDIDLPDTNVNTVVPLPDSTPATSTAM